MSAFVVALWIVSVISAVAGERFYRRLPTRVGEFIDPRVVFRPSSDAETERWRRRFLLTIVAVAFFGLASIAEAWPR